MLPKTTASHLRAFHLSRLCVCLLPLCPQLRADLEQLKQAREIEQDRLQRWAAQLDARHLQIAREADEAAAVR